MLKWSGEAWPKSNQPVAIIDSIQTLFTEAIQSRARQG